MGNNVCNCSTEYENYLKAIASTKFEFDKPFFWGSSPNGHSHMIFYDNCSERFLSVSQINFANLFKFSTGLFVNNDKILIAGGLNQSTHKPTSNFVIYHIEAQTFELRDHLPIPLYGSACAYFLQRFYVFGGRTLINNEKITSNACFEYNFLKSRWFKIAAMNISRFCAKSFIYQNKIWVIGGLNQNGTGNSIEYYEPHLNQWTIYNENLPFDYSRFIILSIESNRICVIGGETSQDGALNTIHHIDLKKKNILSKGSLSEKRVDPKFIVSSNGSKIHIIGGKVNQTPQSTFAGETFSIDFAKTDNLILKNSPKGISLEDCSQSFRQITVKNEDPIFQLRRANHVEVFRTTKSFHSTSIEALKLKEAELIHETNSIALDQEARQSLDKKDSLLDSVAFDSRNTTIQSLPHIKPEDNSEKIEDEEFKKQYQKFEVGVNREEGRKYTQLMLISLGSSPVTRICKRNYIFGNDVHPFYIFIDQDSYEGKLKPVPLELELHSQQSAMRISNWHVFLCGGRSFSSTRTFKSACIYNLAEKTVNKIENMHEKRHSFAISFFEDKIFVIGGAFSQSPNIFKVISSCEVYDPECKTWSKLPDLNIKRQNSKSFVLNNDLFVVGGFDQNGNAINTIEVWNKESKKWELIEFLLTKPMENCSIIRLPENKVAFFGENRVEIYQSSQNLKSDQPITLILVKSIETWKNLSRSKIAVLNRCFMTFGGNDDNFTFFDSNAELSVLQTEDINLMTNLKHTMSKIFSSNLNLMACSFVQPFKMR